MTTFTTKTCTKCGEVKPLTEFAKDKKDRHRADCKLCFNTRKAAWYSANRDEINARAAAYRRDNPDKIAARDAAHREANRDKYRASQAVYCQAHPDKISAYRRANLHVQWEGHYRRRCRKHGITPVVVSFTREDVANQYGDACFYCSTGPFEELDHYIPVAAGGPHTLTNARPSCSPCNKHKANTTDREDNQHTHH